MPRKLEAVPLLEPKQQEQTAQQQYPQKSIQIVPAGLLIQDILSANFSVNTLIPAEQMDEIAKAWREFRHQQASQLQTIAAVKRTRND